MNCIILTSGVTSKMDVIVNGKRASLDTVSTLDMIDREVFNRLKSIIESKVKGTLLSEGITTLISNKNGDVVITSTKLDLRTVFSNKKVDKSTTITISATDIQMEQIINHISLAKDLSESFRRWCAEE